MKRTIVHSFPTSISRVESCPPLCTPWFCKRSELWCQMEDMELQEVHSGSPGPIPWMVQVPNTQWRSTPVGQCQGNALTRFSPHSFFLMLCHSALGFPAENSLHVTNNPVEKKPVRGPKHTASQGRSGRGVGGAGGVEWWQGQFPSEQDQRGFALEGTIRNISFLPKVDCVI